MGRAILGVVVGFLVMVVLVMVCSFAASAALGLDRTYKPGSYEPTPIWIATNFAIGILSALAGGALCGLIGRGFKPVLALCAVALAMGVLSVAMTMGAGSGPPPARTGKTVDMKAAMQAKPRWVTFAEPLVGVLGILAGGRAVARKPRPGSAPGDTTPPSPA